MKRRKSKEVNKTHREKKSSYEMNKVDEDGDEYLPSPQMIMVEQNNFPENQ